MRKKVKATLLEEDDIVMLTNVQIGQNRRTIEREFLFGGKSPYEIYTNSKASEAKGVLIAIKIKANIQVLDVRKDEEDRILILKTLIGHATITMGCIYDDNRNNSKYLTKIDKLLE